MNQEFYLIKEAAAKIGVESHVLRYWEDELRMDIHRNAMGHRYYTEKDIEILSKVKELKERGYQLKAVRDYLEKRKNQIKQKEDNQSNQQSKNNDCDIKTEQGNKIEQVEKVEHSTAKEMANASAHEIVPVKHQLMVSNEEKMKQFQNIMNKVLAQAIRENNELIGKTAGDHAADAVVTKLSGMTKEQEQRAEERFRKLDETLREMQRARAEAAAANGRVDRRKRKK